MTELSMNIRLSSIPGRTAAIKGAPNSSQHLNFDGSFNYSLSLATTIMASENYPTLGEHFVIICIFVTH